MKEELKSLLRQALEKSFPDLENTEIQMDYPDSPEHGDYASNLALRLAKQLQKPPREVAETILKSLPQSNLIQKSEIAGPGFINFFISQEKLLSELQKILDQKEEYGSISAVESQKIVLEYSSPNIAKPLGIHHILSTIIGQSLSNILRKAGHEVTAINYPGDWGTQFGKVITAYKKWGNKEEIEKNPITELLKLYVKFHDEAEKDPALEDEARRQFKIFEEGDSENRELWQWFVAESMKDMEKTYKKLGNLHFDHTIGESFFEDKMKPILEEGKKAGIFVEGREGSYIVEFEDPNVPPFLVQKKDGATLYSTRDFANLKYRIDTWSPHKIIIITDSSQNLHFKQLYLAAQRFPWYNNEGMHINFGRMRMKDASMSTRKGNIVLLDEVLDEAVIRSQKIIEEKSPHLPNKTEIARKVGIGAVKYNILSQNRTTDILFDWDRILALEGNSGPYLQYTYARARSILRKELPTETIKDPDSATEKTTTLLRLFPKYPEAIENAATDYKPNLLSNYLYKLAQEFNSFYNTVPVLKAEKDRPQRLQLVEASTQILKNGLSLLGIEVVEEM